MARHHESSCARVIYGVPTLPARAIGRRVGVSALSVFKKGDPKMIEFAMKGL